jgi:hypothetical protein
MKSHKKNIYERYNGGHSRAFHRSIWHAVDPKFAREHGNTVAPNSAARWASDALVNAKTNIPVAPSRRAAPL